MAYLIGLLLALSNTVGARLVGLDRFRAFYPIVLAVVASYYVLFAAMSGSMAVIGAEVALMTLFLVAAIAGFRTNPWWIVGGLAAHGLIDTMHGSLIANSGVPAWWPAFCATYDFTAALALGTLLVARSRRGAMIVTGVSNAIPKSLSALIAVVALATLGAPSARAQADSQVRVRSAVSFTVVQTRPVGALGRNIGLGYGVTGAFLMPLDARGALSVRLDVGAAEYGSDTKRTAFSESVGGRVEVNVRTINAIVPVSLGLQLTLPTGPIFTYATAGVGGQAFYTESHVEPVSGGNAIASTINQSDVAPAWTVGGGIYIPLRIKTANVALDLGAQYIGGGRAQYLAPGSITDLPGGQIAFTPMETSTHLVVVRLGARIGL